MVCLTATECWNRGSEGSEGGEKSEWADVQSDCNSSIVDGMMGGGCAGRSPGAGGGRSISLVSTLYYSFRRRGRADPPLSSFLVPFLACHFRHLPANP